MTSDGSPNGVFTRISRLSASPGMVYSPLPPIMPIVARTFEPLFFPREAVILLLQNRL
jgi:hypothetical protein